jgi:hypothetical protein
MGQGTIASKDGTTAAVTLTDVTVTFRLADGGDIAEALRTGLICLSRRLDSRPLGNKPKGGIS